MIIVVTGVGDVELSQADDFKGFKIALERPDMSAAEIAGALDGVATVDPDGASAWVSQDALKSWKGEPQTAEWIASFDKMIQSVKRFGWVDEEKATVRAHIDRGG